MAGWEVVYGERRRSHCVPPGHQRQPLPGTRGQRVCVRRPGGAAGGRKAVGEPTVVGAVVAVDKRRDESAHLQCGVLARLGDHTRPHRLLGRQQTGVGRRARPSAALERACGWPWPAACATACPPDAAGSAVARPSPHQPPPQPGDMPLFHWLWSLSAGPAVLPDGSHPELRHGGYRRVMRVTPFNILFSGSKTVLPSTRNRSGSAASRRRVREDPHWGLHKYYG